MPWCPRSQSRCMMEGRLQIPLLHSPAPAGPVRPSPKTTPWAGFGGGWASGTSICVCVCVLGGEGRLRTLFPPQQAGGRQEGNPILQKHQPPTGTLPISGGVGLATDPRVTSLGGFLFGSVALGAADPPATAPQAGSGAPALPSLALFLRLHREGRRACPGHGVAGWGCHTTPHLLTCTRAWAPTEPHQVKVPNKGRGDRTERGVQGWGRRLQLFGGVVSGVVGARGSLLFCPPK